jgi:hypothetical protein
MTDFCPNGLWPSIQSLVAFLTTNVFAHAASIHLRAGADVRVITYTVIAAILVPTSLGDSAFHIISRWQRRMFFRLKRAKGLREMMNAISESALSGSSMGDAAIAGALAIEVPSWWSDARAVAELFTEDLVNRTEESISMGLLL